MFVSGSLGDLIRAGGSSRAYDPPEAVGGRISEAGDMWSLGMTLVEVLTQALAGVGENQPGRATDAVNTARAMR